MVCTYLRVHTVVYNSNLKSSDRQRRIGHLSAASVGVERSSQAAESGGRVEQLGRTVGSCGRVTVSGRRFGRVGRSGANRCNTLQRIPQAVGSGGRVGDRVGRSGHATGSGGRVGLPSRADTLETRPPVVTNSSSIVDTMSSISH